MLPGLLDGLEVIAYTQLNLGRHDARYRQNFGQVKGQLYEREGETKGGLSIRHLRGFNVAIYEIQATVVSVPPKYSSG